jgi:GH25 family lysozyme M1 (1,4-beta-N-acetylmuramidase)
VIRQRGRAVATTGGAIIMAGLMAGLAVTAAKSTPATLAVSAATSTPAAAAIVSPGHGVDVSQYTDVTSWPDVKAAGYSFAGVEAAQGATVTNPDYGTQVTGALAAGMDIMPYVYADPGKVSDGGTQFSNGWSVINSITGHPYAFGGQMLPIALDMEPDPINFPGEPCYGLSQSAMLIWISEFVAAEKAQIGVVPVIYTSQSWWNECTGGSNEFSGDPLWVADYGVPAPAIPSGWSGYTFWQSSDSGTVSGISGSATDVDQHAPITFSVSNRTGAAGTPIWLRVPVSDPDTGYAPALTASGLPPGMSMNSSGVITGWPYVPGTYTVKVSASDRLDGTGSASFTWTVGAAADSGSVGQIRQAGDTGKCLEDPGSKTANGSPVELWTCGSGSDQKWTVVQDGTMRVLGKCLDMAGLGTATNTALQLWTCDSGNGAQQWQAASDGELINPRSGKCIYIGTDSAGNGAKPVVHVCANDARHHWLRPAGSVLSGQPGRCLATSGSVAELVNCANVAAQHWTAETNGTIVQSGKCLAEGGTTAGSGVSLGSCSGAAATKWNIVSAGRIAVELSSPASGLCVSVPTSSTASGTPLEMEACGNNSYSTWDVD